MGNAIYEDVKQKNSNVRKKSVNLIECFCCFRIEETNINYEKAQKRRRSVITALFRKMVFFSRCAY